MMAKSDACRPYLRELVRLVIGRQVSDLDDYVEGFMGYEKDETEKKNEDYYKQYSNMAKVAVKNAVGLRDNVICFLFNNYRMAGRKVIRRTILDPQDILLPQELMDLADRMPDAMNIIQGVDAQKVIEKISE